MGRSFELCRRKSCKYIYIFLINLLPSLFFFLSLFIYLFMAVLGLRFCARAFSSCGRRGPLFIVVHGPLTIAASLVAEHRLQTRRLSSCGSRAQLLRGMWDPPRPGLEPVSPALTGRFSTTAPPGKPSCKYLTHTEKFSKWRSACLFSILSVCVSYIGGVSQRNVIIPGCGKRQYRGSPGKL